MTQSLSDRTPELRVCSELESFVFWVFLRNLNDHFISFHFIIFIQSKYSSHDNIDLQNALLQKKSYKITVKIGAIKYVKVNDGWCRLCIQTA